MGGVGVRMRCTRRECVECTIAATCRACSCTDQREETRLFHRVFASLLHFNFTSLLKIEFNVTVNGDMSLAMQLPSYIQSANAKLSPQGTPQLTEVGAASRAVLLRIDTAAKGGGDEASGGVGVSS